VNNVSVTGSRLRRIVVGALSALLAVSLLGGCGDDDNNPDPAEPGSGPQDTGS
jgi:hypothetical protein